MKKITTHKLNASKTRLSDEEVDPIEKDDPDSHPEVMVEGWLPWDAEDIADIRRLIERRMPLRQREIVIAFLEGNTYKDLEVSEKYWRWHFTKGVEFIKKELKI